MNAEICHRVNWSSQGLFAITYSLEYVNSLNVTDDYISVSILHIDDSKRG